MIILTISKCYYTFTKLMFNNCVYIEKVPYICSVINFQSDDNKEIYLLL